VKYDGKGDCHEHQCGRSSDEGSFPQPTHQHVRTSVHSTQHGQAKKYPALAVAHPFGGVKEQTSGKYAQKMAEKGYVTLAFDASHQGESGGYPRDTENPSERLEDIRCAIDYLTTLPTVDVERIGLLGVCAGGSYVLGVGPTEMRPKAIAAVSIWDMGMMAREGWPVPYDRKQLLVAIGKQRTAEARGLTIRRDDGIPPKDTLESAPQIIKESYDYYRSPRARHNTSRSVFVFTDFSRLMDFNYYARIEEIAPRPILFVVGTNAATLFMSKPGYERATQPKEWFEVPGATHHSLYDIDSDKAIPKLEEFFGRSL
jgi:uncharacterized protein